MDNEFHSEGGEQNIGQGEGAIGKQTNILMRPLKPRTLLLASVLAVGVIGTGLVGYRLLAPAPAANSISTTGDTSPASNAGHDVTVNQTNNSGIPPEVFAEYAGKLDVTDSALRSFFKVLEEQQVPRGDLDSRLREIAAHYKDLLLRMKTVRSEDPEVARLKEAARQAIEAGDYTEAETLLEQVADQYSIFAAATYAELADLQRVQLRYAKAAEYWQKAAALLPEESGKERSLYLSNAGYDLHRIARYKEALPLYEQSLAIDRELGDRAGEGATLNNISQIHKAQGDYDTAFKYLERSLSICQEIGDQAGEGATLNNISQIHKAQGDYDTAFKYLEQSLSIRREIGDRAGEGVTLNNISQIHDAQGDYDTALRYLEQSLSISREIGDRAGEGTTLNNLATTAYAKGDYDTALKYLERNLVLFHEIGDKAHEGGTLNNISQIHRARGDYDTALKYLEQSLSISQEIGDRAGEDAMLNNIGGIHHARGDYDTALRYLERSLSISQEIGDRAGEAVTSWNIGRIYQKQGDLRRAEQYISRAVEIDEAIGHPDLEKDRKALEKLRAAMRGR